MNTSACWSVCRHSADFPGSLCELFDPPAVLFGLGDRGLLAALAQSNMVVTVIGARRASRAGLEVAESLAHELSAAGVFVVSGMALGIDSAAHRGALSGSTPTVAVLGSGADVCYPRRLQSLYGSIIERGLVLSEFPPRSEPRIWTFPARNRLMAALGRVTVVVEARRASGSLITTSMAADLGRDIGAVPGPVSVAYAEGVNALLHDGAHVIRNAEDVLDLLPGPERRSTLGERFGPELSGDHRLVLDAVEREPGSVDVISRASALDLVTTADALTRLEVLGYISRGDGGGYARTTLAPPPAAV